LSRHLFKKENNLSAAQGLCTAILSTTDSPEIIARTKLLLADIYSKSENPVVQNIIDLLEDAKYWDTTDRHFIYDKRIELLRNRNIQ